MSKFKIDITSVPDREHLVAEIWYDQKYVAEINQEESVLKITLYDAQELEFLFEDFINALVEAKNKLL